MKKIITVLTVTAMLLTSASFAAVFNDISGHWAEDDINTAQATGIINGDGSGAFRPGDTVSRAEFVKMITSVLVSSMGSGDISDKYATTDEWYSKYYNAATSTYLEKNTEINIGGVNPGVFDGNAEIPIQRWEMAYVIGNLMENILLKSASGEAGFSDSDAVKALGEGISKKAALCAEEGIIKGDQNGSFNPYGTGTRAEAVVMSVRLMQVLDKYIEEQTSAYEEMIKKQEDAANAKLKTFAYSEIPKDNVKIKFEMEDGKSFVIEVYPSVAPQTAANFVSLVKSGFYDGLTFHRIVSGFVAQGGDPNGDGTGGADYTIKGEFAQNGVNNTLSHTEGVVSMARSVANNSASSQFFICYGDTSFLDGQYAAFGKVIEGMDTIRDFAKLEMKASINGEMSIPANPIVIKKASIQ